MTDERALRGAVDPRLGLDDGEHLLAWLPVSFSRRFATSLDTVAPPQRLAGPTAGRFGLLAAGASRERRGFTSVGKYIKWSQHADSVGFPVAGMAMALAVTERRLCVCRPTFFGSRPKRVVGSIPLTTIAQVGVGRGPLTPRVTLLLDSGGLVELETGRTRRARTFAAALLAARDTTPH